MCCPCSLIYFGESALADLFIYLFLTRQRDMLLLLLNPGAWNIASSASSSFPALFLSMDFFFLGLENLVTLKTEENVLSLTFFPHALVKVCLQYSMQVYYSVSLRNIYKSLNRLNLLFNLASSFTFSRNSILCFILAFLNLLLQAKAFVFPVYYSGFCLVG